MKNRVLLNLVILTLITATVVPILADTNQPTLLRSFVFEQSSEGAAFSADLHWLAANQPDGNVAVWDVSKGVRSAAWSGNGSIAFLPRSNELLLAQGTHLTARELLTGEVLRRLESPVEMVNSLSVSASGNVVAATVGGRRQLVFWNMADGKLIPQLPTTRYPWEMVMRSADTSSGQPRLPISMSAGFCQAFSPDGTRSAAGFERAQVDIWNMAGNHYNHYLGTVSGLGGRAEAMTFLDNRRVAVAYNREQLDVLTLNTNDSVILQCLPRISFTAMTVDAGIVTGEVVARQNYEARFQIEQMGLTPITVGSDSEALRYFHYQVTNATNTTGWLVVATVQATNSTEAAAQFKERGFENGRVIEGQEDIATVESHERALQENLKQHPEWSLLQKRQTLIEKSGLEIRSMAVSGDGRRLAVAGMRMAWRPGVFVPAGDGVFDSPVNAELQIWDAVEMKLQATIKGRPDEKFAQVALSQTGGRVAVVTTGATYDSKMTGAQQQGLELSPPPSRRVYVWELPAD